MPATEQTWRDQKLLHVVFAVSSVVMLIATVWMFAADHARPWKPYQKTARAIDLATTSWRSIQYDSEEHQAKIDRLEAALAVVRGRGVDDSLVREFRQRIGDDVDSEDGDESGLGAIQEELAEATEKAGAARENYNEHVSELDRLQVELEKAEEAVAAAMGEEAIAEAQAAVDALKEQLEDNRAQTAAKLQTAQTAEAAAAKIRERLLERVERFVTAAENDAKQALNDRKMQSAKLDVAKANYGLGIRDELGPEALDELEADIGEKQAAYDKLNVEWEQLTTRWSKLAELARQMESKEAELAKELEDARSGVARVNTAIAEKRSNYFEMWGWMPVPGKKWLEAPILDAFNSPLKIDNLWHEDLVQDFNFRDVRRFDRCTTCHQMMDKSAPGQPTEQGYVHQDLVDLLLTAEVEDPAESAMTVASNLVEEKENRAGTNNVNREPSTKEVVQAFYGLQFADEGLLHPDDLTIAYVKPKSRGAQAELLSTTSASHPGEEVVDLPLQPGSKIAPTKDDKPGLEVGDVIVAIDGDPVESPIRAIARLREAAIANQQLTLTVRRGLPHPYVSHPRLDLFVGSLSPHPQAVFACTICHEGQGSATEFKWSSHTPNSSKEMDEWKREHGWFDNHHWIYPMYATRFMESGCLKCHHDVTELERSDKFPESPAPKVTKGYHLIAKYGCFGCHEINGYDGQDRAGPDLRAEPNFFAAAQQLKADPGYASLDAHEKELVNLVIKSPELDAARHKLYQVLAQDAANPQSRLSDDTLTRIAPLLNDVENPGKLRRVGPSLRYVDAKLDPAFLYDWIKKPSHFRPSSRMPQFFGLWSHLEGESLEIAKKYEPLEILGVVRYLQARSQSFDYIPFEKNVDPPSADRGKTAFQLRCVACHSHEDFPEVAEYRDPDKIQQGPDLSNLAAKFNQARNPNGRAWLYTWLKEPTRYHVRTLMPDTILDPLESKDPQGNVIRTDPAADIVEYMLSQQTDWEPAKGTIVEPNQAQLALLNELVEVNLRDTFYEAEAESFAKHGIPLSSGADLKGAERELLVADPQFDAKSPLDVDRKLMYIGKKVIGKYGCYGCHDIPGFEEAKPIGAGLAEWGRKEPSKLAFEHIHQFLHHGGHGHGEGDHAEVVEAEGQHGVTTHADDHPADHAGHDPGEGIHPNEVPSFYMDQLNAGNRIGFIYQKLASPRSYDYEKTEHKRYNERLRMPMFPFDDGDREAVITFVLGLVGSPPPAAYVYQPSERDKAIQEGQAVIAKYNCGGCHILDAERWDIAFEPGRYGEQSLSPTYPFVTKEYLPAEQIASATPDRRNLITATLRGMPMLSNDGRAMILDDFGDPVFEDDEYKPFNLTYLLQLWQPALIEGESFQVGGLPLEVDSASIERRLPSRSGDLAKYLLPHVVDIERQTNQNAKGSEAWAWVPPPLLGEGNKVQTDWLHEFLLDPYAIRPAVFMRMPKFGMSPEEATKLVNYFAAKDNANYPYAFQERQRTGHLLEASREYQQKVEGDRTRLDDAMKIVTSQDYCVKCHIVGDFNPTSSDRAKAPDLAEVYRRLRSGYLRKWIGMPASILPYTAMPVNIKYDPDQPNQGTTVPQDLYHGTSTDQVDALVDLLMNYDKYARRRTLIAPLVKQPASPAENTSGEE